MKFLSEIRKLRDDTLKGPTGDYSRKSLTTFTWVVMSVLTGIYIVYTIPEQAINVFYGYLALAGGALGLTVVDKIKNGSKPQENVGE